MKQTLGDLMDKLTILTRKVYFGEEEAIDELTAITHSIRELSVNGRFLATLIRLAQMNFEIWNLENDIRKGGEGKFSLEEIGRRAILIRDYNRKRIKYKNEITRLTGKGFTEVKINHRSQ